MTQIHQSSQPNRVQQSGRSGGQSTQGAQLRGQLFPTQSYLRQNVRVSIVDLLDGILADATMLETHAKYAHWNVKGMAFYGLHELFDEIAETFDTHTDMVAERITALGGQAMGTAGMAVSRCRVPAMPTDAVTGTEYVEILADRLAIHDANLAEAIKTAQHYGDDDTADLLNEISREVSQYLWFLEAHLQTQPVDQMPPSGAARSRAPGTNQRVPPQGTVGGQHSSRQGVQQ